eukprot:6179647-Pleurochrysis_carterae.AAC.1
MKQMAPGGHQSLAKSLRGPGIACTPVWAVISVSARECACARCARCCCVLCFVSALCYTAAARLPAAFVVCAAGCDDDDPDFSLRLTRISKMEATPAEMFKPRQDASDALSLGRMRIAQKRRG